MCRQIKTATVPKQVKEIAQAAIDSINQLTSLTERRPTTASGTFKNSKQCTCSGGKRQLTTSKTTFVRQTQPANRALAELQRRFLTVSRQKAVGQQRPRLWKIQNTF